MDKVVKMIINQLLYINNYYITTLLHYYITTLLHY